VHENASQKNENDLNVIVPLQHFALKHGFPNIFSFFFLLNSVLIFQLFLFLFFFFFYIYMISLAF